MSQVAFHINEPSIERNIGETSAKQMPPTQFPEHQKSREKVTGDKKIFETVNDTTNTSQMMMNDTSGDIIEAFFLIFIATLIQTV